MKTASAKAKGRRFQQKIAKRIGKLLGIVVGADELIASREMGQSGTDIRLIGEAKKNFPFAIECKNQERWEVHKWIEQAKSNQDSHATWLLFCTRNRQDPVIVMDAEDFFQLYQRILEKNSSIQ